MRIYANPIEAVKEVERDLWEMGIRVHPQTVQDKFVSDDAQFDTVELQAYGLQLNNGLWRNDTSWEAWVCDYIFRARGDENEHMTSDEYEMIAKYIDAEFDDRISGVPQNPGNAAQHRPQVWNEFLHNGKFSYTYSERLSPQLSKVVTSIRSFPDTRQAIMSIHSNITPFTDQQRQEYPTTAVVQSSADLDNMNGKGRIPCSMYYQFMRRKNELQMIYTMRSCDYLTHFAVDIILALRMQAWVAERVGVPCGMFTYFIGSLHAYTKDMQTRGIF